MDLNGRLSRLVQFSWRREKNLEEEILDEGYLGKDKSCLLYGSRTLRKDGKKNVMSNDLDSTLQ